MKVSVKKVKQKNFEMERGIGGGDNFYFLNVYGNVII